MANKLNLTGLSYFYNRIKTVFANKTEFNALSDKVDDIISEGGEPNVIEIVKVDGVALTPDAQKAVDIAGKADVSDIPTDLSELTNTGTDPYATESYVDENGGKIDVIKVNNTALPISEKAVNIDLTNYALSSDVPTATSDLTNDSGFVTQAVNDLTNYYLKTETYTKTEVDNIIGQLETITLEVVEQLPTQDISTHTIYLLKVSDTPIAYDEYIYIDEIPNGHWEKIGSTNIDLASYWTMTSGQSNSLIAITTAEIDTIVGA